MADLGSIGTDGYTIKKSVLVPWANNGGTVAYATRISTAYAPAWRLRSIVATVNNDPMVISVGGSGSNSTEGTVTAPSLRLDAAGVFKFRWSVINGNRTIQVFVKQPLNLSPRPLLRVKANPAIGVLSDGTAVASSGTDWVSTGTVAISPTGNGAVWVHLENRLDGQTSPCHWDRILTT